MDYEKKYKEAVNKIKNLLDDGEKNGFTIVTYKTDLESIFPELCESEDERIKNEIIDYISTADDKVLIPYESWIAWLEKQGNNINCIYNKELSELLHIVICRYVNDPDISYTERENVSKKIFPYVELLEKQSEQKSVNYDSNEDERIRKLLVEAVIQVLQDQYCSNRGVSKEKVVAWLEKQGETYTKKDVDDAWLKGMCDAKRELEKQAEVVSDKDDIEAEEKGIRKAFNKIWEEKQDKQKSQRMISAEAKEAMYDKPADTVEQKCEESKTKIFDAPTPFEDKLYVFVAACEFLAIPSKIEFILEHSQEILDAAREQIGKEQSSAWSEEDELVVEDIEEAVINYWHGQSQEDLLDWLKSLKTKVQPKQEWSEKDEEELEIAIDTLKESGRYDSAKWVQSLKRRIGGKL